MDQSSETLDMKALGPSTFGLMKQSRHSAKVVYQGLKDLVKFGKFAETEGVQTSSSQTVVVAEEHAVPSRPNLSSLSEVFDDDDDDDDDDDESDSDNDGMDFRMFVPTNEPVNEAVISLAETEKEINILKQQNDPTSEQWKLLLTNYSQLQENLPKQFLDKDNLKASLLPRKRKRRDPRSRVLSTELVQQFSQIIEPTQVTHDVQSPIIEPTQVIQDVQSPIIKPSPVQEDESIEKDLLIGSLDVRVLTLNMRTMLKMRRFLNFKQILVRLHQKFGDDFQPLSSEGKKISASSFDLVYPPSQHARERVVRPALDANLDTFLSSGPFSTQERREKQARIEQLKGKMLVMKHSDQNAPGDQPEMFLRETGKKFTDKYGDRSGILMWGYHADKEIWVVKRKSCRIKYYEKPANFMSWTKVDLAELIYALFNNPTNDSVA
uniref:Uncharacterized protein n=1 Tax=Lactuca sativa TaxID=4236 RepID=A0A9R1XPS4_LACSA|nr:hypothetical protein LSAT_V11C200086610 [Lactuca sativa]